MYFDLTKKESRPALPAEEPKVASSKGVIHETGVITSSQRYESSK